MLAPPACTSKPSKASPFIRRLRRLRRLEPPSESVSFVKSTGTQLCVYAPPMPCSRPVLRGMADAEHSHLVFDYFVHGDVWPRSENQFSCVFDQTHAPA